MLIKEVPWKHLFFHLNEYDHDGDCQLRVIGE